MLSERNKNEVKTVNVGKYKRIIEDFLNEKISADEFQSIDQSTFLDSDEKMDGFIFDILNHVFESSDCYWHECKPGEETDCEISENQLRKEVAVEFEKLNKVLRKKAILELERRWCEK